MVRINCKLDFTDVGEAYQSLRREVKKANEEEGKNAVEYAKQNGNYQNRTGTLRRSNRYEADEDKLVLINDAKSPQGDNYASNVESKGFDVLSGGALLAESNLRKKTKGR